MKTLATIFSLVIFFATAPAHAQGLLPSDKTSLIFENIQNNIHVPDNMKNNVSSERVRVVFTIDEKGHAHVIDVNTDRPDLKSSVVKQFESLDFSDASDNGGQTYSIWLNFKVM